MLDILQQPFFQRALLTCVLAGIACGIAGTLVVVRRISSISGSLSHAALGGVGIAHFFAFNTLYGATAFAILSGLVIATLYFTAKGNLDNAIMIVWTIGMTIGVLFISVTPGYAPSLEMYLFGSLLMVPSEHLYIALAIDLALLVFVWSCYYSLRAVVFDEEHSSIIGLPVKGLFYALIVIIALAVVVLLRVVGVVLMIALFVAPALTAQLFYGSMARIMLCAVLLAVGYCLAGLFSAYVFEAYFNISFPTGPLVVIWAVTGYVGSLAYKLTQRPASN